jgi:tellurite resistance protein
VSEERNQIREEQSPTMANLANWESHLQARANDMLARRIAPLKADIEHLQGVISEISSRLAEQDSFITGEESSGFMEQIKQWFDDRAAKDEEDFKSRIEEASANARREAEIQIEELREQLEASRGALTMAVASASQSASQAPPFEQFTSASEDIVSQRTQSDILAALVRHVAQFAPRVVFFVIKSGDAVGWKANGFENGLNDETVKSLTVPVQKRTLLRDAVTGFRLATGEPQSTGDGDGVSEMLGLYSSPMPERAIAIPLIVLNKAVAVLYADSGAQSEGSLNTVAAESLTRIAGKTIELLISRRAAEHARPSAQAAAAAETPYMTPFRTDGKEAGASIQQPPSQLTSQPAVQMDSAHAESGLTQDSVREIYEDAPQMEISAADRITIERRLTREIPLAFDKDPQVDEGLRQAEAQLPEPAHIETEPGVAPEPRIDAREGAERIVGASGRLRFELPTSQQSLSPMERMQQPAVTETVAPASSMPASDFAVSPVEELPASSGIPSFSPPPAPPIFTPPSKSSQSVSAVPGSETEQRAHNDARRFARLLVSEIKLYNAAKVNDGRRNYDLYERLKDEIDRSRKVYDKRVSPAVAARFDYFYDELVQTLAEGDPAKLGQDCPGPVAVA